MHFLLPFRGCKKKSSFGLAVGFFSFVYDAVPETALKIALLSHILDTINARLPPPKVNKEHQRATYNILIAASEHE